MAESNRRGPSRPPGGGKGRGGPAKGRGGPPRSRRRKDGDRPAAPRDDGRRGPKEWGGVARRGAGEVRTPRPDTATDAWREAVQRARDGGPTEGPEPQADWVPDAGEDEPGGAAPGPPEVDVELSEDDRRALGRATGRRAKDHEGRLKDAAKAFRAERFDDARRILAPLAEAAPAVPAVRELYGLTLYRLGRWKAAIEQLEAFHTLTRSTEQHPVLADCHRALGRHQEVQALWDELRAASPSAELVTEGRIVVAGDLADQGRLSDAIALLGQGRWRLPRHPRDHHLRRAYALADLFERAGEVGQARDLFGRIQRADPRFADVGRRLKAL